MVKSPSYKGIDMSEAELRKKITMIGRALIDKELTYGTCGNISCRIPGQESIMITPSSIPYEKIKNDDILIVDFKGHAVGERKPSVETPLHLAIYKKREDVGAIIHTHSLHSLAVSSSAESIPVFLDEIFSNIGGFIDVAPYAIPGSDELAENIVSCLQDKNAVLLSNHGAVCCGKNLDEALEIADIVEKICKIFIFSSMLDEPKTLPFEGKKYQRAMFEMKKRL